MAQADVQASQVYAAENWESFTTIQRFHYLRIHHPDKAVRDEFEKIHLKSELTAKMQMMAPWYQPGDERSEARFSAMVAGKYGVTWWRDTESIISLLGVMDHVWSSKFIEPLLIKTAPAAAEPDVAATTEGGKPGRKRKRKYTKDAQQKIKEHWESVKASGDQELIGFYLTGAEEDVSKSFGVARNTLRESEFFSNRDTEAMDWRRRNGKPSGHISQR